MKKDLFSISAEISSVSMIVTGLSNHLDENCTQLTPKSLQSALFGVSSYLDRIVEDLDNMEDSLK